MLFRSELASLGLKGAPDALWLSKSALVDLERCEGRFHSALLREGPPFAHSEQTAAGALFHKAIEVDIGGRQEFDLRIVAERAARRLNEDDSAFALFWGGLDELDRLELMAEGVRRMELFRASLPPLVATGRRSPCRS